jgi:ComEC/Rec2-related protein
MGARYPAIFALLATIFGILVADATTIDASVYLCGAFAGTLLGLAAYFRGRTLTAGLLGLAALATLSAFNYACRFRTFPAGHIIHYADDNNFYDIYGTVSSWPVIKNGRTNAILDVDSIALEEKVHPTLGRIWLNIQMETTRIQYGDRLFFRSGLHAVKSGRAVDIFDYSRHLNLKGVFAAARLPHVYTLRLDPKGRGSFQGIIGDVRQAIIDVFARTLDPASAALAAGFLIGETRDIPPHIYGFFRSSGTLHLLAVSGSNVALVVFLFAFLLRGSPVSRATKTATLVTIIVIFCFLSYNQPSVVRASIMAILVLTGKALQRRIDLNNIIAATALVILSFNPADFFDIGFQLSFVTAWGLILFVPRLTVLFENVKSRICHNFLIMPLIVCLVAQSISLPLCAYHFRQIPMISFISNLAVIPLVSIGVIAELILLMAALILPLLADFLGSLLNPVFRLIVSLVGLFGSDTLILHLDRRPPVVYLIFYYLFLLILGFCPVSKKARRIALLYLLLTAGAFLTALDFAGTNAGLFTIIPAGDGIIAVSSVYNPQVILCNLPSREYPAAATIVRPYLRTGDGRRLNVIVLSPDFATLREAVHLSGSFAGSNVYVPESSKNLLLDLFRFQRPESDTTAIIAYGDSLGSGNWSDDEILLGTDNLIYLLDSTLVIFGGCRYNIRPPSLRLPPPVRQAILITPGLSIEDIADFYEVTGLCLKLIICSEVMGDAEELPYGSGAAGETLPKILQLPRLGTVRLDARESCRVDYDPTK